MTSVVETARNDFELTKNAVEKAERLAKVKDGSKNPRNSVIRKRQVADALHREADRIYRSGDYETALVLYHRASKVYPRDSRHGIAANGTVALLNSWSDKFEPNATTKVCPRSSAIRAMKFLEESNDPPSVVDQALRYLDNHETLWRVKPRVSRSMGSFPVGRNRSESALLRQLKDLADITLKSLEETFDTGDAKTALKISKDLLLLSAGLPDPRPHQLAAYDFQSLSHGSLGRHDRAVKSVSRMLYIAKSTANEDVIARSLLTMGKVHLSFGHFLAGARAWQSQANELNSPVVRAWLFHEIGRCYFERRNYGRSLDMASRCLLAAKQANSNKWLLYGKLLRGQTLVKLTRLNEALRLLKTVDRQTDEIVDTSILAYTRRLIDHLSTIVEKSSLERTKRQSKALSPKNSSTVSTRDERSTYANGNVGKNVKKEIGERESISVVKLPSNRQAESEKHTFRYNLSFDENDSSFFIVLPDERESENVDIPNGRIDAIRNDGKPSSRNRFNGETYRARSPVSERSDFSKKTFLIQGKP